MFIRVGRQSYNKQETLAMDNKLTSVFFNKLFNIINSCEGAYWNEQETGFVIADLSKFEDRVLELEKYHLRTFLKKLIAYGFRRRTLFEGVEYIHPEIQHLKPGCLRTEQESLQDQLMVKYQEEMSIEMQLKHQQLINDRLIRMTKSLEQRMDGVGERICKRCEVVDSSLNTVMFKIMTQDFDKRQLKAQVQRIKLLLKSSTSDISHSLSKLQQNITQEREMVSVLKESLSPLQGNFGTEFDFPVKEEQEEN